MVVKCITKYIELPGGYNGDLSIPSVAVICPECGHSCESYGDHLNSIKRCCTMLREECPKKHNNLYVTEETLAERIPPKVKKEPVQERDPKRVECHKCHLKFSPEQTTHCWRGGPVVLCVNCAKESL